MHFDVFTMNISDLNLDITIEVMLPDNYKNSNKQYPVIYMNDGQYAFRDNATLEEKISFRYEQYYKDYSQYLPEVILVAIHAPEDRARRTKLYTPYEKTFTLDGVNAAEKHIHGDGIVYLDWMTTELKSYINKNYRTLTTAEHTGIFGFSTGALNAIYAILEYPNHFTRAIVLSSSVQLWWDKLASTLDAASYSHIKSIYIDVGTNEVGRMSKPEDFLIGTESIYNNFVKNNVDSEKIKYNIFQDLQHRNADWLLRFPDSIRWIMKDFSK